MKHILKTNFSFKSFFNYNNIILWPDKIKTTVVFNSALQDGCVSEAKALIQVQDW